WADSGDRDHLAYVAEVLIAQGWPTPTVIAETTRAAGLAGLVGGKGDPFFAVIATKPA
ncbi:MAG: SAM-dependent methyltransferase, partial [Cyanobacteriota bacterium]|nr:SAM-dependent methyltransferase [Cyanobacteriota bacterium]